MVVEAGEGVAIGGSAEIKGIPSPKFLARLAISVPRSGGKGFYWFKICIFAIFLNKSLGDKLSRREHTKLQKYPNLQNLEEYQ